MARLDMSDVLGVPEFRDTVTVIRRSQGVNEYGEVTPEEVTYPGIPAVLVSCPPNELERHESMEFEPRSFTIFCKFRLQAPTGCNLPDLVFYLGDRYVVRRLEPYSRYGRGYVEAVITSQDFVDRPV
jgi:hypothetical protein